MTAPKPVDVTEVRTAVRGMFRWLRRHQVTRTATPLAAWEELRAADREQPRSVRRMIVEAFVVAFNSWLFADGELFNHLIRTKRGPGALRLQAWRQNVLRTEELLHRLEQFDLATASSLADHVADYAWKLEGHRVPRRASEPFTEQWGALSNAHETVRNMLLRFAVLRASTSKEWNDLKAGLSDALLREHWSEADVAMLFDPSTSKDSLSRKIGANRIRAAASYRKKKKK